jgi:lysozyme family protein
MSYTTLMDAQAGINAVKADVSSGKVTLTATQKTVLNQAITDYDLAQASWLAYHSGATTDVTGLTSAINQIVADIAALATKIQGGK